MLYKESFDTSHQWEFWGWHEKCHLVCRNFNKYIVIDGIRYARSMGPRVLSFLESYFNISFPLPKQDMFAIPDFAVGAMENWGLVTYR